MNIYLIRHGRQNSTLCNVDVELSKEGREQADLLGKRLAENDFCKSLLFTQNPGYPHGRHTGRAFLSFPTFPSCCNWKKLA